jgi:hypothetical protein
MEYQPDKILGYKPIPNARTHHVYKIKDKKIPTPNIPIVYDNNGFRIPLSEASKEMTEHKKINLLFLGCSFTFVPPVMQKTLSPFWWQRKPILPISTLVLVVMVWLIC